MSTSTHLFNTHTYLMTVFKTKYQLFSTDTSINDLTWQFYNNEHYYVNKSMQHSVLVSVMQFSYLIKNVLKLLFCLPILDFTETVNLVELIITAEDHNTNWLNSKKITRNKSKWEKNWNTAGPPHKIDKWMIQNKQNNWN